MQNKVIKQYVDSHVPLFGYSSNNIDKTSDETIVLSILTTDDWLIDYLYPLSPSGSSFYFSELSGVGITVFNYLGTVSAINENGFLSFEIIGDKKIYFGILLTSNNTLYDFRVINVGNIDISSIGDGTITGAIGSLNSGKANSSDIITTSNGFVIGTSNASVTIPTVTATTIGSVTVPTAGLWLIEAYIYLPETSSTKGVGDRRAWLYTNETTVPANRYQIAAPDGTGTIASGIKIENMFNLTAGNTIYLRVYQNSGSDMSTTTNGVRAAKLMK